MIIRSLRRLWQHFLEDNLFRNSIYLMLTTGIMGGLGFFFWIICTHLFTPEEIGIGTTLISAMGLISYISLLGFNSSLVRILPTSTNRDNEINTASILIIVAAGVSAIIYIFLIPYISPSLTVIQHSIWYSIGFIVIVTLASLNSLTDSIFVAYRGAQYTLLTSGIMSGAAKIALPFLFVSLGAYGVFAASGLAAALGMVASVIFLMVVFNYRPKIIIDTVTIKKIFHYSFTNYIANLLSIIPTLILPTIVINHLGAAAAGYYYLAFMVINLLYSVSGSVSQSLFAEGSYTENTLKQLIKKSATIIVVIMLPSAVLLAFVGPYVLQFFGKSYSAGGGSVIVILALAAPAVAAFNIGSVLLRLRHQMYSLLSINLVYTILVCGLTLLWVDKGLFAVALAWTAGNSIAALLCFISIFINRKKPTLAIDY